MGTGADGDDTVRVYDSEYDGDAEIDTEEEDDRYTSGFGERRDYYDPRRYPKMTSPRYRSLEEAELAFAAMDTDGGLRVEYDGLKMTFPDHARDVYWYLIPEMLMGFPEVNILYEAWNMLENWTYNGVDSWAKVFTLWIRRSKSVAFKDCSQGSPEDPVWQRGHSTGLTYEVRAFSVLTEYGLSEAETDKLMEWATRGRWREYVPPDKDS